MMRDVFEIQWRMLTFRMRPEDADALTWRHVAFGLFITWLVGMGRWWDDPEAHWLLHAGVGSLAYVLMLAGALFLFIRPLGPRIRSFGVGYRTFLAAVSLTALPGLLYAIPVERWTDLAIARSLNAWFLGFVAAWRVTAWLAFVVRTRVLHWWPALMGTLLPLALIVTALAALNLERATFNLMGGLRDGGNPHAEAYLVVMWLTFWALMLSPVLLFSWVITAVVRRRARRGQAG